MLESENLPLVLLTHPIPEDWIALIQNRCNLIVGPDGIPGISNDLVNQVDEAQGMITFLMDRIDESLLRRAPKIKVISNYAVGYDNIDVSACTERGIPVGNTPGVLTDATADLTFSLILATTRRIMEASQDAREGHWGIWRPDGWLGTDLQGTNLGILGMGNIGTAVARRAAGFGLKILYTDPHGHHQFDPSLDVQRVDLEELLGQSDILSIHSQLTPETRGLINATTLRKMKPRSILINTARGQIVDTDALYEALARGDLWAAGLDVTDPEPLPPNHPLYQLPNCIIVPHIGSATYLTRKKMAEIACKNLLAGLDGKRLPNCVNPEVYE